MQVDRVWLEVDDGRADGEVRVVRHELPFLLARLGRLVAVHVVDDVGCRTIGWEDGWRGMKDRVRRERGRGKEEVRGDVKGRRTTGKETS